MVKRGFDIVPRLPDLPSTHAAWAKIIDFLIDVSKEHPNAVRIHPRHVEFRLENRLILPRAANNCLRVCIDSADSEPNREEVRLRIDVKSLEKLVNAAFDGRARFWDESRGESGFYDWADMEATIKACTEPNKVRASSSYKRPIWSDFGFFRLDSIMDVRAIIIPTSGMCMFALRTIQSGTRITANKALLYLPKTPLDELLQQVKEKVSELSQEDQRAFYALPNRLPDYEPLIGTVLTNAEGIPGLTDVAIYLKSAPISWPRASCAPNAHYSWNRETGYGAVHTIRRLKPGEEILIPMKNLNVIPYQKNGLDESLREACVCPVCSQPAEYRKASDARRMAMVTLVGKIRNSHKLPKESWTRSLGNCHRLIQLCSEEYPGSFGPWTYLLMAYSTAAMLSMNLRDYARATSFLRRLYDLGILYQGTDHPDTKSIKKLLDGMEPDMICDWLETERPSESAGPEFRAWLWKDALLPKQ